MKTSHTGKKAIIVSGGKQVVLQKSIEDCFNCGSLQVSLPSTLPTVSTIGGINLFAITANPTGGTGPYTYEWKVEGGNIIGNNYGSNTVLVEKRIGAFRVIVSIKDSNGCIVSTQYSFKVIN